MEDEHLAGGRRAGADADRRDLELLDDRLGDRRRDRLEDDREAADRLQREGVLAELDRALRGLALGLVAAERGRGLRRQADVAHHRDAGADDRPRPLDRGPPRLQLDHLAAGLLDQALGALDRELVARLVAAHRHVADHQRRLQAAAHGLAEHHHLVHRDRLGAGIAEHDHRRRVADQDEVDAGLLGDPRRGVVVGGDHHDRFAGRLHLGQARQGHRRRSTGGGAVCERPPELIESSTSGWLSTATSRCRRRRGRRSASRPRGRSRRRRRRRRR